jgi:transcriptional regulator with XRE-family HTH domain
MSVAQYINECVSTSMKTQREIAEEAGFDKPNMITMLKQAKTKLPLDRVAALADALGVSRRYLMILALQEYHAGAFAVLQEVFGMAVTDNEASILNYIRLVSGHSDPGLGGDRARERLREIFGDDRR